MMNRLEAAARQALEALGAQTTHQAAEPVGEYVMVGRTDLAMVRVTR